MIALISQQLPRIGSPILGYIIPTVVFVVSFYIAYRLYKHFTKQMENE